jgi:hypothetical protein
VETVAFSPDGKSVVSAGFSLRLWEAASGKALPLSAPDFVASCAALSPDGKTLVAGGRDQTLRLFSTVTGKESRKFAGTAGVGDFVAFLPDGRTVLSKSQYRETRSPGVIRHEQERFVRLWDVGSGKEARQIGPARLSRVALSPDGRTLAAGSLEIALWDVASGKEVRQWRPKPYLQISSLAFSPDGRLLAVADGRKAIHLFESATGQEVLCLAWDKGGVFAVAVSPNGRLLASGGADGAVRLWDLGSGKARHTFTGHQGAVFALVFSPDGTRLVSGSADATALVWGTARFRGPERVLGRLRAEELKALWSDLGGPAPKAYQAVWRLAQAPGQSEPLLGKHLKPVGVPDAKALARWIKDLEDEDFEVRAHATKQLGGLGPRAVPALRKALAGAKDADLRLRLQVILRGIEEKAEPPDWVRSVRAVQALEQLGTAEARKVLQALAKGAPEAWLTREAKASLDRLARRPAGSR